MWWMLIPAAMQMAGSLMQGQADADAAEYEGELADAQGIARAKRIREAGRYAVGQTRAAAVAGGVSVSSDSVLDAERQTVQNVEQDAMSAILSGQLARSQSDVAANNAEIGGLLGAAGSAASSYGKWKSVQG